SDAGSVRPVFERSAVAGGIRTTAAAMAPLIIGYLMGRPSLGTIAAIGALNVSLADIGGLYRSKAQAMAVATIGVSVAVFLATVPGSIAWLAPAIAFLVAAAGGLAGVFGNAADKISFSILGAFVIALGLPAGVLDAGERLLAVFGGGLWAM